jgi:hypothetical protein
MLKRLLWSVLILLPVSVMQSALYSQTLSAPEETKARPNKQEIRDLVIQISKMPGQQQNNRIEKILADQAGGKTSRADFMFCTGLAYLGNAPAQFCVAKAYENGLGVVEDLSEAYTWYALACRTGFAQAADARKAEETRDTVKERLASAYPHPTEEDLEDQVNAQKTRIAQYQEEIKKAKK